MPWLLIRANLKEHWFRTLLTVGSLAVATFLLCFLQTVLVSLEAGVNASNSRRLMAQSAVSLFVDLPQSYQGKIQGVPGVDLVCKLQWFGAYYLEPSNFFAQFAVDQDKFFDAYPEVELIAGKEEDFGKFPTACVIGSELSERFGWKVGSKIPLIGTIFPRSDGRPWEFEVVGIYTSKTPNVDNSTVWFHFKYLEEAINQGSVAGMSETGVGVYLVNLKEGADGVAVSAAIDKLFENGPQRVQTSSAAEFQKQFVTMLGSVPIFLRSIGGAILFAILLAAINTMLMSARQRTHEFGVLKALGFTDGVTFALLMSESILVSALGGALGLLVAIGTAPSLKKSMATVFPSFELTQETMIAAAVMSLAVGVIAGIIPALQASRLSAVDALRAEV